MKRRFIKYPVTASIDGQAYVNDPRFDSEQIAEIRKGARSNVDISVYANPKFNAKQMREIRRGLENWVDVSQYADPNIDSKEMYMIREGLEAEGMRSRYYREREI